eukprot:6985253-Pyramimonas_sp.AAC.1
MHALLHKNLIIALPARDMSSLRPMSLSVVGRVVLAVTAVFVRRHRRGHLVILCTRARLVPLCRGSHLLLRLPDRDTQSQALHNRGSRVMGAAPPCGCDCGVRPSSTRVYLVVWDIRTERPGEAHSQKGSW